LYSQCSGWVLKGLEGTRMLAYENLGDPHCCAQGFAADMRKQARGMFGGFACPFFEEVCAMELSLVCVMFARMADVTSRRQWLLKPLPTLCRKQWT
jgi:hypothetical protein